MFANFLTFSLITATHNSQAHIRACLQSILQQSYTSFEIIIVDAVSNDNTLAIINDFRDLRIKVISEPDNGLYDALNKGILRATGDVIGFVHSDDMLAHPNVLQEIALKLNDPNIDGVYGNLKYIDSQNTDIVKRNWKSKSFKRVNLYFGWMPPHPTLYLKKHVYQELGLFNTNFKIAADYDFMLRLLTANKYQIEYLTSYVTLMRVGGASNKSISSILQKSKEDLTIINRYPLLGIVTLVSKNLRKITQFIT